MYVSPEFFSSFWNEGYLTIGSAVDILQYSLSHCDKKCWGYILNRYNIRRLCYIFIITVKINQELFVRQLYKGAKDGTRDDFQRSFRIG